MADDWARPVVHWAIEAVDLPRQQLWERVLDTGRRGAGTLLVPASDGSVDDATQAAIENALSQLSEKIK